MEKVKLNTIEEAIEDFKTGNFVIIVDDEDRENEGDLIIAAENITPRLRYPVARSWICLTRCPTILPYWGLPSR